MSGIICHFAITAYDRAIERDPKDALAYVGRSIAYRALGRFDQALADANKAIELDPKLALAYDDRAATYNAVGQYEKALADATKAIQLDPYLADAYETRATAYGGLGQYDKALADATKAIELDSTALIAAAFTGRPEIMRVLLSAGADANAKTSLTLRH